MDTKMMQKMMLEGMRTFIRGSLDAMDSLQEQMIKMWKMVLEQSQSLQKEGEKAFNDWLETMRKSREEFRRNMDEGLRKLEEVMGSD